MLVAPVMVSLAEGRPVSSSKDKTKLWARRLWGKSRKRAREAGIEFTLQVADIVVPDKCPILGVELMYDKGINDRKPSLDRIDSSKGYVPGNVRVISWRANYIKGELSPEQIERLYLYTKGEI